MQFSGKEDIEAPAAQVFAALADFASYERWAIRRGIHVKRLYDHPHPQVGMAWQARFELRGRPRKLHIEMETYTPQNLMQFAFSSQGVEGRLVLELVALSAGRTRMSVVLDLKPKTLPARLLVQSLKLARSSLTKRFKLNLAEFARNMEERLARAS
ncbi:SRPBCC family protein [Sedimentitalea nanhaiensis]|uniref:Polyketide cyclase / dehydrase and lipid transport n=1 Tax=Sedimentitalea nanhaiensis TaxID=999627 RepID=A0A1I7CUW3_9RHOB|nr:SRPBCC family protein [Sedimentitalea nanhaiensis]SFU03247.1 Polyketide cyclase / dehydrase and lipid transport [Sedimentitalea nanhaiensis]